MTILEPLPVPAAPVVTRYAPLDVLRGVALLGILVMNIQSFAMPEGYYGVPRAFPTNEPLEGLEHAIWLVSHVAFDQKMMTLFSMLFGAGIVLMTSRREAAAGPGAARVLHYRRMAVLLVLGLVHAYGLWYGDILFYYAVCGMLLYPVRRLWPGGQLAMGLVLWLAGAAAIGYLDRIPAHAPLAQIELDAYRYGYMEQVALRAQQAFDGETWIFAIWVWQVLGLIVLGMALVRWRVLTGERRAWVYAGLVVLGAVVGLPVVAAKGAGMAGHTRNLYNYLGSLPLALGWAGAVLLACKSRRVLGWLRPMGAVGRMALTNYLLQTVICTTIFYGHGLGWFGRVDRVGQVKVVLGVWMVELALSVVWLRWFAFGPVEWLWRSATYWRWQQMRKG